MQFIQEILSIYEKNIRILIEEYISSDDDLNDYQAGLLGIDIVSSNIENYIHGLVVGGHIILLQKHMSSVQDQTRLSIINTIISTAYTYGYLDIIKLYERHIKGNYIVQAISSMNKETFDYEYNRVGNISNTEYSIAYSKNNTYVMEKFDYEVNIIYKRLNACRTDTLNELIYDCIITPPMINIICECKSEKIMNYLHSKGLLNNFYMDIFYLWPEKLPDLLPVIYESDKRCMVDLCTNKTVLFSILEPIKEKDIRDLYVCIVFKKNNHVAVKIMLKLGWSINESVIHEAIRNHNNDVILLINMKTPQLMETAVKSNNITAVRHFMCNVNQSIIDAISMGYDDIVRVLLPFATKFTRAIKTAEVYKRKNMLKHIAKASKKYKYCNPLLKDSQKMNIRT